MKLQNPKRLAFAFARLERIHTVTQRYIDEGKFAGIVTLIARRSKLVHFASVGKQEIAGDKHEERLTFPHLFNDQTDHHHCGDDAL